MLPHAPTNPYYWRTFSKTDSHTLAVYEAGGGYRALRKALKEMSPDDVLGAMQAAGLRGRGGAGFPTGLKWSFLPEDHPGPIYFCVNGDESEPGTFVNRVQMENDPHQVLEGIILSCYATRATTAYLYLRYEYPLCLPADAGGHRRGLRGRLAGQEYPRLAISPWTCSSIAARGPTCAARRPA